MKALIVIPTYNEAQNIEHLIDRILFQGIRGVEILVVDDNSPDGTAGIVENIAHCESNIHLMKRSKKAGLGTAYVAGFKYALARDYDYVFEMDADFSHDPNDLIKLYDSCAVEGNDLSIGSRYVTGVNVVNWPMSRVLMSFFASKYVRFITGMPIQDTTAGFKCFKREVLETIDLDRIKFVGYAFQIEMKFKTWKHGFKLNEVPIIFTDRTRGTSKMSSGIFKEAVLGVIQLKFKSLFRKYPGRTK